MIRHLIGWIAGSAQVQDHIRKARICSRCALACAARSSNPNDSWATAARLHRTRRDALMWAAREIARRPRKRRGIAFAV